MVYDVDATWSNAPDASSDPVYDAADLRRADAAMFAGAGSAPLGVRGGIVLHADNSLQVTVDGSDQVTVQPGAVVIPGDAVASTGCYRTALPVAHTEALPARHSTSARIDLVVFRMLDVDVVGTHTGRKARIEVIPGTASGTPAVPAKPSMAVELARVTVPASGGAAASVDLSKRTFAATLGGTLLVATESALPATSSPWQDAVALDTGTRYRWDGTAWDDGTWETYTPALASWTLGNGTITGRYRQIGATVHFTIKFTAGGTSTFVGNPTFSLPVLPRNVGLFAMPIGGGSLADQSGAGRATRTAILTGGDVVLLRDEAGNSLSATSPWTWANTDTIEIAGTYEAA